LCGFRPKAFRARRIAILRPMERFPVYHIVTPRLKNPNPPGKPFTLRTIYPDVFEKDEARARKYYA